ncbi:cellulase family glycosylhydrolase [Clostridium estertheticum]|uniref:cellulase family glycosylhydrolase n=1 Tax=Clostridium estertheticum TaxID=238834 RepID=UPI00299DE136|nr:cellulase family glycosylhydrolase [Clostridium estertheticum]
MFLDKKKTGFFKRTFSFKIAFIMLIFVAVSSRTYIAQAATSSVSQLKIVGSQLCDSTGKAIQLKGMSSHGLQWYGDYMNYDSMKYLRDNWGVNVVRAAMYTDQGGYISNPTTTKAKVKEIVQAAIDLNMYVIIDWHILNDGNPNTYKEQSKSFFKEMATTYGNHPNVIYEICNEPNGSTTWANDIKPYAQYIIPAIRAIDPDNIIIVGTSTWSQDVDTAANSPLSYSNIMYACHFYAGTHGQSLRDKIDYAMAKGIAVFVTEWGTSDASGNGGPYIDASQQWIDYMANKKISWVNWSLCDKSEAASALKPGDSKTGGWTDSDLTTSGLFVKKNIGGSTSTTITSSQVSAPASNIAAGTYNSTQTVTLSCSTLGDTIYYTTDGTTPTSSSHIYTSPITVSKTTTIKALAIKSGMTNSNVTSVTYTIVTTDTNTNTSNSSVEVMYTIGNDWGSGSTINVTIKNNGTTAINGWTLSWTQPVNQSNGSMWNATYSTSGSSISVKNMSYNAVIAANGGTQTFGFNINYKGLNTKPISLTLNGISCKIQ